MIASILKLSRSDFKALEIIDIYSIHRVVYSLFPKEDGGRDFLFADKGGDFNERRILIFSKRRPLEPEHGSIETKEIPQSYLTWDYYGFEIRLNPTRRDKNSGKIIPAQGSEKMNGVTKRKKLLEWFCAKSEGWGFSTDYDSLEIRDTDIQYFEKKGDAVTQNAAIFIGKLKVCNRPLFIKSFEEGIGRGKGFGFGLLEIIPLKGQTNK